MSNDTYSLLIVVLVGLVFLVIGLYKYNQFKKLKLSGIKVAGTVFRIDYESNHDSDSIVTGNYYPVIRYLTNEKDWITEKYTVGSNPCRYSEGDKVAVIYDPSAVTTFIIDDAISKIVGPLFIGAGAVIIIGSIIYWGVKF